LYLILNAGMNVVLLNSPAKVLVLGEIKCEFLAMLFPFP
jgi:hypothetical protein